MFCSRDKELNGWGGGGAGEDMTATEDDQRRRLRLSCLEDNRSGGGGESTIDKINEKRPYCTPVPQCQGHLLTRGPSKKPLSLILSNSDDRMQSQRQRDDKHEGGGLVRGRLRHSDDQTQSWRQKGDERGRCHSSSATAMIKHARGGGEGPPAPQRSHHHPSTRGPSTRC